MSWLFSCNLGRLLLQLDSAWAVCLGSNWAGVSFVLQLD